MKISKKIWCAISFIFLFTACTRNPITQASVPESDILSVSEGETLRIMMPIIYHRIEKIYSQETGALLGHKLVYPEVDEDLDVINHRLQNLSYNLHFEMFVAPDQWDIDYYSHYVEYIKQNINSNMAFILPNNDDYYNIFNISGLENNKLDVPLLLSDLSEMLGDFHDVTPWLKNHPAALAYNEPGTLVLIPTGCHAKPYPNVLSVLVREDIAEEYAGPINTASDYEVLLDWIIDKGLSTAAPPGMLPVPGIPGPSVFPSLPYDIFLPEMGLYALKPGYLHIDVDSGSLQRGYLNETGQHAIHQMIEEWINSGRVAWHQARLLAKNDPPALPTIMVYSDDVSRVDGSGYRIYPLYDGMLPYIDRGNEEGTSNGLAIAGKNADLSYFFIFLEMLNGPEAYNSLFYGEEGVDYRWNNDRIEQLSPEETGEGIYHNILWPFVRTMHNQATLSAPHNFEEALGRYRFKRVIKVRPDDSAIIEKLENDLLKAEKKATTNPSTSSVIKPGGTFYFTSLLGEVGRAAFLQDNLFLIDEYANAWQTALDNAD